MRPVQALFARTDTTFAEAQSQSQDSLWSETQPNAAFEEYRQHTLRQLEEEERAFRDFLGRLRMSKDRAEFDQFVSQRRSQAAPDTAGRAGPETS